jgi:hypothetical protein
MFYLIETEDQLEKLESKLRKSHRIHLEYIQGNDNTHPALAEVIAIYINTGYPNNEGYIIPINHPECINWDKDEIFEWLRRDGSREFYVRDKKAALHTNPTIHYTDIQHCLFRNKNILLTDTHNTQAHAWYYRKFAQIKANKMIPIGKHHERCESKHREVIQDFTTGFDRFSSEYFDDILLPVLHKLEQNTLKINDKFDSFFEPKCKKFSIKENHIYGQYNPYTTTGRPVNNFNGINFVGLKHDNGERDCFEPHNDVFVEMDYDGYHPRLIGDIVGYEFEGNVHNILASIYFGTDNITPEQYKESKTLTFKQIYGGIDKANLHHPFFKKTQDFIDIIWEEFNSKGHIEVGGYSIKKEFHPKIHSQKLFNYYIQATETYTNILKIKEIQEYLEDKKTNLVLYIYDAFIFDFSKSDTKQTLFDLQNIVGDKFPIKVKVGDHYGALA